MMPVCQFFRDYRDCTNADCLFLHVDPELQEQECAMYVRGFCQMGTDCQMKHVKKFACDNYLLGFCPDGPNCEYGHPKWELPEGAIDMVTKPLTAQNMLCPRCNQPGHRAIDCPNVKSNHDQLLMGRLDEEPADTAEAAQEQIRRLTGGSSASHPMVIEHQNRAGPSSAASSSSSGPWTTHGGGTGANRSAIALNPRYLQQ